MVVKSGSYPFTLLAFVMVLSLASVSSAFEVNEKLAIEGSLTGVYQHADTDTSGSKGRGTAVLDLGVNFKPTERDEFQATVSYSAGNGLNYLGLFSLVPYADDLEDDLKDINGRNRDYLLEAWYSHTFSFAEDVTLSVTGGIIDSTGYIDDNRYANCECTQFMNEAFVNHRNVNLPSYDLGGTAELKVSDLSIRALAMSTKFESDDGNFDNYNYYALQAGYTIHPPIGEGNYRLYGFTTNDRFPGTVEGEEEKLIGFGISADQQLSRILGAFARISFQDDEAVIEHETIFSGGLNINGKLWGREQDEMGIGYAYLDGAEESEISHTIAAETYLRLSLSPFYDLTLDLQYIKDEMRTDEDEEGFIYGVRMYAYF
jgi:hypothetical protein